MRCLSFFYYFAKALRGNTRDEDSQVCGQSHVLTLWSAGSFVQGKISIYKKLKKLKIRPEGGEKQVSR